MDELLRDAARFNDLTTTFTLWDAILAMLVAFLMSLVVAKVYQWTHTGVSYSASFSQTLVLMAVVVATIMIIVGSNIARAFSLVGALSIIRFRTAIKDSRDVAFVFFAMAVGMAAGTRFYLLAVLLTLFGSAAIWLMQRMRFGAATFQSRLLRLTVDAGRNYESLLQPVFRRFVLAERLAELTSLEGGARLSLDYVVDLKPDGSEAEFVRAVGEALGTSDIHLLAGEESFAL